MKTSSNNNNIESNNRVINYDIEIVRDFDGTYYVNARNELHEHIKGLPEYLPYKELKKAVKEALGVTLPPLKSLTFEGNGRKQYANAYGLQGIEIHQEPLAFGLQDKVILGSFGESRPYAIGCTVTGYRWSAKAGEFLYILQGEDGKEYADFARNIIPDNGNDPKGGRKATLDPTSEITEFFTKGKKCRCIKSVIGNKSGRLTFTKGQVYEQYTEPSVFYGWLRNNQGERHAWPQPQEIANECDIWGWAPADIDPRLYFEPVEDTKEAEDVTEAEGVKVGDKVRHNKHEEVATVTAIREAFVNGCDGYRYLYTLDFGQSVKGPFDVELNGGEFLREAFTLQETSEIKPKATDRIESRKRTIIARAKQDKQAWRLVKGCEVRVRKAYTNGSSDPENWTYCVSWYADGQLVECENGVRLEQAARALNDLPQWAEARKAA